MGKLLAMPHMDIVAGFKGSVDFYLWKGIPCFRSWPRSPGKQRAPAVMAQWPSWTYASREWNQLSKTVQDAYRLLATNSGLSGRDMQMRAYLQGLYRYPIP
ncbi:hypothetical protein LCGC14_1979750 [marine sediment metagenome]|uniref:Uncharacterized protein n=1 Tax=marine sediment metagenome TaxID=412755 RepID=A0A0F9HML2_9ZZZZ